MMHKFTDNKEQTQVIHTARAPKELVEQSDLQSSLDPLVAHFTKAIRDIEIQESGWALKSIDKLDIKLINYTPLRGGCLGKLPSKLASKKCIVQLENNDQACLKWSITLLTNIIC